MSGAVIAAFFLCAVIASPGQAANVDSSALDGSLPQTFHLPAKASSDVDHLDAIGARLQKRFAAGSRFRTDQEQVTPVPSFHHPVPSFHHSVPSVHMRMPPSVTVSSAQHMRKQQREVENIIASRDLEATRAVKTASVMNPAESRDIFPLADSSVPAAAAKESIQASVTQQVRVPRNASVAAAINVTSKGSSSDFEQAIDQILKLNGTINLALGKRKAGKKGQKTSLCGIVEIEHLEVCTWFKQYEASLSAEQLREFDTHAPDFHGPDSAVLAVCDHLYQHTCLDDFDGVCDEATACSYVPVCDAYHDMLPLPPTGMVLEACPIAPTEGVKELWGGEVPPLDVPIEEDGQDDVQEQAHLFFKRVGASRRAEKNAGDTTKNMQDSADPLEQQDDGPDETRSHSTGELHDRLSNITEELHRPGPSSEATSSGFHMTFNIRSRTPMKRPSARSVPPALNATVTAAPVVDAEAADEDAEEQALEDIEDEDAAEDADQDKALDKGAVQASKSAVTAAKLKQTRQSKAPRKARVPKTGVERIAAKAKLAKRKLKANARTSTTTTTTVVHASPNSMVKSPAPDHHNAADVEPFRVVAHAHQVVASNEQGGHVKSGGSATIKILPGRHLDAAHAGKSNVSSSGPVKIASVGSNSSSPATVARFASTAASSSADTSGHVKSKNTAKTEVSKGSAASTATGTRGDAAEHLESKVITKAEMSQGTADGGVAKAEAAVRAAVAGVRAIANARSAVPTTSPAPSAAAARSSGVKQTVTASTPSKGSVTPTAESSVLAKPVGTQMVKAPAEHTMSADDEVARAEAAMEAAISGVRSIEAATPVATLPAPQVKAHIQSASLAPATQAINSTTKNAGNATEAGVSHDYSNLVSDLEGFWKNVSSAADAALKVVGVDGGNSSHQMDRLNAKLNVSTKPLKQGKQEVSSVPRAAINSNVTFASHSHSNGTQTPDADASDGAVVEVEDFKPEGISSESNMATGSPPTALGPMADFANRFAATIGAAQVLTARAVAPPWVEPKHETAAVTPVVVNKESAATQAAVTPPWVQPTPQAAAVTPVAAMKTATQSKAPAAPVLRPAAARRPVRMLNAARGNRKRQAVAAQDARLRGKREEHKVAKEEDDDEDGQEDGEDEDEEEGEEDDDDDSLLQSAFWAA